MAASNISFVAHNDYESRSIAVVAVADKRLDARSTRACVIGGINGGVDALLFLPCDPVLECGVVGVCWGGDDNHLDGCGVKVGVIGVDIQHGTTIEQLLVDDVEIGAIGSDKLVFGSLGITAVKMDFHLDVVEDTHRVVDGVVADGLDAHLTDLNATHDAIHVDGSARRRGEATGLVGGGVVDKRHFVRILVLAQRRLAWHQSMDAIVFEAVVGATEACNLDTRVGSER